jgi:hypothetical protein
MDQATAQPMAKPATGETMTGAPVEAKKSGWLKWVIIVLVVLILGLGAYWYFLA